MAHHGTSIIAAARVLYRLHIAIMVLITTKDYLAEHPTEILGGNGDIDPIQPIVEFAFGAQPEITRNKDLFDNGKRRKKIGVVGAGDSVARNGCYDRVCVHTEA